MTTREVPLPRKLYVGGFEFPLRTVAADAALLLDGGEVGEVDGITHFDEPNRGIYLREGMARLQHFETVLHEIAHAINWVHDIADGAEEEAVATAQGAGWSVFYLDNPRFQRWLNYTINRVRKERADA